MTRTRRSHWRRTLRTNSTSSAVSDRYPRGNRSRDPLEQRGAVRDGASTTLPLDGPSAALKTDVVRGRTGDQDSRRVRRQRQSAAFVLQQNLRLANSFSRHRAVGFASDTREQSAVPERIIEEPQ